MELSEAPAWLTAAIDDTIDTIGPLADRALGYPRLGQSTSLQAQQFEHAFEPILEAICGGATLDDAVQNYPVTLDKGRFNRWIQSNAERKALYVSAKEYRSEVWSGRMVQVARGVNSDGTISMNDVARDRLEIDVIKFLMSADNRKVYGETKQIDVTTSISITAALEQAGVRRAAIAEMVEDAVFESLPTPVDSVSGTIGTNQEDGE